MKFDVDDSVLQTGQIICHFIHVKCHSCCGKFLVLRLANFIIWNVKYKTCPWNSNIYTYILLISKLWNIKLLKSNLSVLSIMKSCIKVCLTWYMKNDKNDCNVFQIIIISKYSTEIWFYKFETWIHHLIHTIYLKYDIWNLLFNSFISCYTEKLCFNCETLGHHLIHTIQLKYDICYSIISFHTMKLKSHIFYISYYIVPTIVGFHINRLNCYSYNV